MQSAKILVNGQSEIDYRNATSRAYYSAYHEAKRVGARSNGHSKKSGTHNMLIEKLKTHIGITPIDQALKQIGILLSMCKKQRTKADYFLNVQYSKTDAQQTINLADKILQLTHQFP
ncbi:HEPN domain-containing protein [Legionella pneumophila serogroup 1]